MHMARLFLGLDSSTQSLSAVVIDLDARKVTYEKSINFDQALPQFKTKNGVLACRDPLVKHSSPLLWAAALDLLFAQMKKDGVALGKILAVSGCGQQHGSVYLNEKAAAVFENLDPKKSLVENLTGVFARKTSPIWMDSSTAKECAEIRKKLGGIKFTASRTGSDTFERFTGPQIRKFYKTEPKAFAKTAHVALVSSFMASLLAGKIAPIDFGDGAGMNLMDIRRKNWNHDALKATAPGLTKKLPLLAESGRAIGPVSAYFVQKFAPGVPHQWQEHPDPRGGLHVRYDAANLAGETGSRAEVCARHEPEHRADGGQARRRSLLRSDRSDGYPGDGRLVLLRSLGEVGQLEGRRSFHRGGIVARPDPPAARPPLGLQLDERQRQPSSCRGGEEVHRYRER